MQSIAILKILEELKNKTGKMMVPGKCSLGKMFLHIQLVSGVQRCVKIHQK